MTSFEFTQEKDHKKEALFLPFFEEDRTKNLRKVFQDLSSSQKRAVRHAFKSESLLKSGSFPVFSGDAMVIVLFLGKKKGFDMRSAREAGEGIAQIAKKFHLENICISQGGIPHSFYSAFCEGIFLGTYEFNEYKGKKFEETKDQSQEKDLKKIIILRKSDKKEERRLETMRNAMTFTKDLINTPPSISTPSFVEEMTKKKFKDIKNIKIKVLGEKELEKLGAGGILGVGRASDEESRFLVIEYFGGKKEKPLVLIGKGITYDTGGLSLKPARYMYTMKQDLGGCATVLGSLYAIADSGISKNVVAVLPLAENLIGKNAYKPDDVLKMMNGKTVEVVNTDAEGRLILADALCYAEKEYTPRAIVDLATLTGSCSYAVGDDFTAGLSTDKKLFAALKKASEQTQEPLWELPLHARYEKALESKIADIVNSAEKLRPGTIEGGLFLKNFVTEKTPWCHLDIASVAFSETTQMGTGRNVRLLWEFVKEF